MTDKKRTALERLNHRIKTKLLRHCAEVNNCSTVVDGLTLTRREEANQREHCFYRPAVGLVVQGGQWAKIGSEEYRHGELHCLVTEVDMPGLVRITEASPERPFLALSMRLDKHLITQLSAEISPAVLSYSQDYSCRGTIVTEVEYELLDAFSRLVDLLDHPTRIPVLTPLITRELHYRLLLGEHGRCLRQLHTKGTQSNRIATAISWLRANYRQAVHVGELAARVQMAPSTFNRHFRLVTTLSPLQYQKRLRLYQAQRLMLAEDIDADAAARAVGYESATQFNREYKRLFGQTPYRDIARIQAAGFAADAALP